MITIYPVHPRDEKLALENLKWWNELGGCPGHECLLVYDNRVESSITEALQHELHTCFHDIYQLRTTGQIDGWPEGANYMFRIANAWVSARSYKYFLWMEPDATPLKEKWMDILETEYKRANKPFLGGRVEGVYQGKQVPIHMTGIAVYPNPLYNFAGEAYRAFDVAWDIARKDQIIPKAYFTNLFCHAWHHPGFKSMAEVDAIPETAVIYHGVKDTSLLHLLRQKRSGNLTIQKEPVAIVSGSPAPPSFSCADGGDALAAAKPRYGDIPIASPGVHKLPGDVWVIEGDMISGVIKEKGRLDADELIPKILPFIKPGDVVIDGGAFVGDHSIAYADAVGEEGRVLCFEPNPVAFQCLEHNLQGRDNTGCFKMGLGSAIEDAHLCAQPTHQGGAYIGKNGGFPVEMVTLDSTGLKPNFIKLDLEGYELHALKGAAKTIMAHRPTLVVEINEEALLRQGTTPGDIFSWLVRHHYTPEMLHDCSSPTTQLYDIIAFPKKLAGQMAETT